MSAHTLRTVLRLHKPAAIRVPKVPVVLTPIPWGKPDRALGFAVIQHMTEVTPGTVIPWTIAAPKLRATLRTLKVRVE